MSLLECFLSIRRHSPPYWAKREVGGQMFMDDMEKIHLEITEMGQN